MRVLAAMSGGVDSAVAAARLVSEGHEVVGVHLALSKNAEAYRSGARGCCSLEDSHDARRAADVLGIPFYVWDFADRFADDVVADFVNEYAAGRTPNPCLRCNEKIKFAAVLERGLRPRLRRRRHRALRPGRAGRRPGEPVPLRRAGQGPVLRARRAARRPVAPLALPARGGHGQGRGAGRGRRARACWSRRSPTATTSASSPPATPPASCSPGSAARTGDVVDERGDVVGAHAGSHQFTIGQRHGLHLSVPAADGRPAVRARHRPGRQHRRGRPEGSPGRAGDRRDPSELDRAAGDRRLDRARAGAGARRADAGDDRGRAATACASNSTSPPSASRPARRRCTTTAIGWSAAPPSLRRPPDGLLQRRRVPARHRFRRRSAPDLRQGRACRTCRNCPPAARGPR